MCEDTITKGFDSVMQCQKTENDTDIAALMGLVKRLSEKWTGQVVGQGYLNSLSGTNVLYYRYTLDKIAHDTL